MNTLIATKQHEGLKMSLDKGKIANLALAVSVLKAQTGVCSINANDLAAINAKAALAKRRQNKAAPSSVDLGAAKRMTLPDSNPEYFAKARDFLRDHAVGRR